MTASAPRDSVIAVVGDGFGSLLVNAPRATWASPDEITIFGPSDNPVGTYQQFAYNLGQTVLRSESESHFLPADWPTFAQLDAWSHRSLAPLCRSDTAQVQPRRSGDPDRGRGRGPADRLGRRARPDAVGWLQRADRSRAALRALRRARQLHRPRQARDARARSRAAVVPAGAGQGARKDPRGGGPASCRPTSPSSTPRAGATSCSAPGSRRSTSGRTSSTPARPALALTRNPQPETRTSTSRAACSSRIGIDAYHGLPFDQRIEFLGKVLRGTRPERRDWLARIEDGQNGGSLRRADRRDRRGRAGTRRAAGVRLQRARRGSGLARRDRRRGRHRLQQVGADDPAAASADRVLRRAGRSTVASAADQLRRTRPRPAGLAPVLHGTDRQQRDPPRRHDRRAEVHRAALRRRLRPRREAAQATVHLAPGACRSRWGATWRLRSAQWPRPSSSRRGERTCVRPYSAACRRAGRS